jgi:hypothetical protein
VCSELTQAAQAQKGTQVDKFTMASAYSQYHPLRKSGIKKTRHGFLRKKIRNHEIPQDLDDFELRNPVNPLFWAILS